MRKQWIILLALAIAMISVMACGDETVATEVTEVESETLPPVEDTGEGEPEVGDEEGSELILVDSDICEQFETPTPVPITPEPGTLQEIRDDDWIFGPDDATVTFLVYSDFQ